ncbi:MAG TPA: hypothetical protein VI643_08000, partial [Planctomycetota bacterium]|nr:hypothetical protein [Planctomycetota bacterium]
MVASSFFSEADRKAVSEAIAAAERATAGEIVPVVSTRSGDYDRAEDLAGLGAAMLAVWGATTLQHGAPVSFVAPVAAFVGFWIGVFVAQFCPTVIRFL